MRAVAIPFAKWMPLLALILLMIAGAGSGLPSIAAPPVRDPNPQ